MDNWKHRSTSMKCDTCMWFVPKVVSKPEPDYGEGAVPESVPAKTLGRCRRHAPTMSGFPATFDTDWCGDHKLNEERI